MASNGTSTAPADGDWVCLVASDGFRFVLPKSVALGSTLIKDSLNDEDSAANFAEADTQTVQIHYRGIIVGKVVEYLTYKAQYQDVPTRDIIEDFTERIEPELALELLMAADFLDC